MRIALSLLTCLAACAAEVPPVPEDCTAIAVEEHIQVPVAPRLRVLALLDERVPLPADVTERLARAERILREGDIDGSGTGTDLGRYPELTLSVRAYDPERSLASAVAPEVPEGFGASATLVAVVIVTTGDITPAHGEEAEGLTAMFESPGAVVLLGVARDTTGTSLARLVDGMDEFTDAELVSIDARDWERELVSLIVGPASSCLCSGACLPRPLARLDDGRVRCTMIETLHPEAPFTCDTLPGRVPTDDPGRCTIAQVVSLDGTPPDDPGWYYDEDSTDVRERCGPDGRRLSLTPDVELVEGSRVDLTCVAETGACTL